MASRTDNVAASNDVRPKVRLRRSTAAIAAGAFLLGALGACAGDASEGAAPAATVRMGEYFFSPGELTVPRDSSVLLRNEGALVHSWVIQGPGVGTAGIAPGRSYVLTLKGVRPGRYTVYCDQMGHTQAGQRGVLVIA